MSRNDGKQEEKDEFFDPAPASAPAPSTASRTKRVVAVLIAALLLVGGFLAGWFSGGFASKASMDENLQTFLWALDVLDENYYRELDKQTIYDGLFNALRVDNYTQLFLPVEYDEHQQAAAGKRAGAGFSVIQTTDSEGSIPVVYSVTGNSPAERAGLRRGMYVFGYGEGDKTDRQGTSSQLVSDCSAFTGEYSILCGYRRDGSDAAVRTLKNAGFQASYCSYKDSEGTFSVRYDRSETRPDLLTASMAETEDPVPALDEDTAYIRLDSFNGYAAQEFEKCLSFMKLRGRKDLILDLRSNGGGYLTILGEIASYLMRNAQGDSPVIMSAHYRDDKIALSHAPRNLFPFEQDARFRVLADEATASASECLLGVMVDYGTVEFSDIFLRKSGDLPARTFGKGIMQSEFENSNGAAIKLTVATVHWPVSDRCIHGVGVTEADGAIGVPAPFIWGDDDPMLNAAIASLR